MSPEEEVSRAQEAELLLNHTMLKDALDEIERATIQKWEMAESKETRDDYWRLYKIAKLFRQSLQSYVETGKLAQLTLEEQKRGISRLWRS